MEVYKIIGLMSGTSLDGLDIALCEFRLDKKWDFEILDAETISYDPVMKEKLASLSSGSALDLAKMNVEFGKYSGEKVADFVKKKNLKADLVASHGHTIFHQPVSGYTLQIGEGAALSVACGLPVVCDFRTVDVALGGQGAPLVPIGDELLFGDYTYCLNLGGIANISFNREKKRMAFDICACNILFNYLAQKNGKAFDLNGDLASSGKLNQSLLIELDEIGYYSRSFPKSLGREDVDKILQEFFDGNKYNLSVEDMMATAVEHVSKQIGRCLTEGTVLVTGGGAFNSFLMERIRKYSSAEIVIPIPSLVNYKEALIFAFLGLKRWRSEVNCLATVTGAVRDNIGGSIYLS